MNCPRDGEALRPVPFGPGELVWDCPQCESRAVALPVLRRHLGEGAADEVWQRARAEASTPIEAPCCASCAFPMMHVQLARAGGDVDFDVCLSCSLVWYAPSAPGLPRALSANASEGAGEGAGAGASAEEPASAAPRREAEEPISTTAGRARVRPADAPKAVPTHESWLQDTPMITAVFAVALVVLYFVLYIDAEVLGPLQGPALILVGSWSEQGMDPWTRDAEDLLAVVTLFAFVAFSGGVEECFGKLRWIALFVGANALCVLSQEAVGADFQIGFGLEAVVSAFVTVCMLRLRDERIGVWFGTGRDSGGEGWFTFAPRSGLVAWLVIVLVRPMLSESVAGHWHALLPALGAGAFAGTFAALLWREPSVA